VTKKYDAITDAFERGRIAERLRLKNLISEALFAVTELLDTIGGQTKDQDATGADLLKEIRKTKLAPPLHPKKENTWRNY
jgi:hypothetical protein